MGRNKTRKKNQRSGQASDDQDPDVSETEPSSSDNISTSLNDTVVLSNNVMDTDVEDSEQTTGDSTPADESAPGAVGEENVEDLSSVTSPDILVSNSTPEEGANNSRLSQWLDDQQQQKAPPTQIPSVTCTHVKASTSMPGIRKSMKSEVNAACSAKPCVQNSQDVGAGDSYGGVVSSKDLWICLQCGHFGCGDHNAQGGDAETHFKTPRSDPHNLVLKFGGEMDKAWCFTCQTFVDVKNSSLKEAIQFLKRHPKLRLSMQSNNKTGPTPVIALGPPPPPPQPETTVENTQFKSLLNKNKMNSRNKASSYSSNWDNSSRDEWPLGLENLGNTCFMNSALQCLSRTKSLSTKLDLYGTGNTIEILVTADPPSVEVIGTVTADTNGENASSIVQVGVPTEGPLIDENGDSNHVVPATEIETGGSSPSSSEMDSLLDVASGTSSKSSPSKDLTPENYKEEIEKELKKCLRLKLVITKDSMTSRLRHAFKAMTRSADVQQGAGGTYSTSEFFGRGRHVFTPSAIHNAMAKHFRPGQQHDSHELLRTVVDMMKKDQIKAFRLAIMQCYGIKKSEGKNCDPKVAELLKMWDRKLYHKTFVDEIFGGELVTFQTCMTCQSVRKSHEDFLDLSLPIRVYTKNHHIPKRTYSIFDDDGDSNRSLEDCLNSFIEPEQLTGSNAVECENCHRINLEKLAAGASFEEVFPGVKPPVVSTDVIKEKPADPALETEMDALEPLTMEEESPQVYSNATEDMDDLDEPAVDGIIGNTSDMEDEGNDVPPIFLLGDGEVKGITTTTEFLSSTDIPNKETMSLSLAVTQDEGFSESDSSEEKKSASISASSSRNSISEADNVASSSQQKSKEATKPIPITKCPCSRRQMVWRPPECLTIHLKRFQITSHGTSKLSDRVKFPYILNLTPFCAPQDDDVEGRNVFDEDGEVKYALYGIVEHSGSLHWGHYVAYIKVHGNNPVENSNGSSGNNTETTPDKWFYISDSSVSPSSLESVQGMDPYILFYERIRGQEKKDKLAQLQRLTNPCTVVSSSTDTTTSVAAAAAATSTSTVTSSVAGCSFDFNNVADSDPLVHYALD